MNDDYTEIVQDKMIQAIRLDMRGRNLSGNDAIDLINYHKKAYSLAQSVLGDIVRILPTLDWLKIYKDILGD